MAKVNADKKAKAKQAREADRAKREAMKTLPELKTEAKTQMHLFVRLRDQAAGCISCGQPFQGPAIGGAFDAGHYRSVGSAKHLEFDPRNVHGQCKDCNKWGGGDPVRYRVGLIARIGLTEVEALERDETPRKYTRDQVRDIREHYRAEAARLKKRLDSAR